MNSGLILQYGMGIVKSLTYIDISSKVCEGLFTNIEESLCVQVL